MEAVFTLPYPEHIVAETLAKLLPKKEGFSVNIPLSRQQKGIDLLVYCPTTRKVATFQVKSSRSYRGEPPKRKSTPKRFNYYLWFRKFDYLEGTADFYVLFGLYPKSSVIRESLNKARKPQQWWTHRILLLPDSEMKRLLLNSKGGGFFGFGFDTDSKEIFLTRGAEEAQPYERFIIERQAEFLSEFLMTNK